LPRRDIYHDCVRNALIKEGWTITHDPLTLPFGGDDIFIDIGAEAPLGAEKEGRKIAVEIKSFRGPSGMADLQQALGQYRIYRFALARLEPTRVCYLALSDEAYAGVFRSADMLDLIPSEDLRLLVFDVIEEEITRWIPVLT
jgi:hypothetical protein